MEYKAYQICRFMGMERASFAFSKNGFSKRKPSCNNLKPELKSFPLLLFIRKDFRWNYLNIHPRRRFLFCIVISLLTLLENRWHRKLVSNGPLGGTMGVARILFGGNTFGGRPRLFAGEFSKNFKSFLKKIA